MHMRVTQERCNIFKPIVSRSIHQILDYIVNLYKKKKQHNGSFAVATT